MQLQSGSAKCWLRANVGWTNSVDPSATGVWVMQGVASRHGTSKYRAGSINPFFYSGATRERVSVNEYDVNPYNGINPGWGQSPAVISDGGAVHSAAADSGGWQSNGPVPSHWTTQQFSGVLNPLHAHHLNRAQVPWPNEDIQWYINTYVN
jgi:hypothetical protein